ncbi:MAG: sugar phosphate isomerase/epimerase [Pirellulaceae bacterium]|jgi:sugar phosphate isomerase/epimerase
MQGLRIAKTIQSRFPPTHAETTMTRPSVILTGFADEAANQKTAVQQFSAFAALGLQFYTIRFIDAGNGVKNVMKLNKAEINTIRKLQAEYGLNVSSLGSPIGKVKLLNVDDKSKNAYIPFAKYLKNDVNKACDLAHAFETKLIRGFSFYHPRGTDTYDHLPQVVDQLGEIAETCHRSDLTFGLEVEANLVGQTGDLLAEIHRQVNHPALVLIFDAGNIVTQGYSSDEVFGQYHAMKKGMGWMHIKDYRHASPMQRTGHVDEAALKHFVPADIGDSGHEAILRDFKDHIVKLERKLKRRGIPGVFLDLEPHVKGGGQFGGFSGPDGLGVALRGLCKVLDYVGIDYHLRDFEDVKAARGF